MDTPRSMPNVAQEGDPPAGLPARIETVAQLDDVLTSPSASLVRSLSALKGDLLILGVAGKMGPTLARLARRGLDAAGSRSRIVGVARFGERAVRDQLAEVGIETVQADLLAPGALDRLPDAANVVYMAGRKFGSTGNEEITWTANTFLPGLVARRYADARIVVLSTGNVYPFTPVAGPAPDESQPTGPVGEYAQSCLGRERVFEYFSRQNDTPCVLVRLCYAIDLRYGVLLDIARKVSAGQPIDLSQGFVNLIWQGDANEAILRSLEFCASPPLVMNLTGPDNLSVRQMADALGRRLGKQPIFESEEQPNALLVSAKRYCQLMGPLRISLEKMLDWVAGWVQIGGPTLNKPTHYEVRDGDF